MGSSNLLPYLNLINFLFTERIAVLRYASGMSSLFTINHILDIGSYKRVLPLRTRARLCHFSQTADKFDNGNIRKLSTVKMCHGRYPGPVKFKENNGDVIDEEEKKDVSQATLIWRAVKLPIYSVALVPLTVASAVAYLQTGEFSVRRYIGLLVSSIFIITWLNLSNDVYDFDTGADKDKKESVVNIVGSRTGTLYAANLLLVLGFSGLTWVARQAGNLRSILLLFCSVMCGYVYQCPPFRLSYQGLGEPLCFASFGPFTTTAFYLMQITSREMCYHPSLTSTILAASILVGYTTTLILFCSHFHQVEGDRAVGKFSPLVRVGRKAGSEVVKMALVALYACLFILGLCNALPLASIVSMPWLFIAFNNNITPMSLNQIKRLVRKVRRMYATLPCESQRGCFRLTLVVYRHSSFMELGSAETLTCHFDLVYRNLKSKNDNV